MFDFILFELKKRIEDFSFQTFFPDLFLFGGLVHFGLEKVDEFGLLGDGSFHLHLLMRINSLWKEKKKIKSSLRKTFF